MAASATAAPSSAALLLKNMAASVTVRDSPAAADADLESDCEKWIAKRLRAETTAVTICIEEQHRKFLEDLNDKFGGVLGMQSSLVEPPGIPRSAAKESNTSVGAYSESSNSRQDAKPSLEDSDAGASGQMEGTRESESPRVVTQKPEPTERGKVYKIESANTGDNSQQNADASESKTNQKKAHVSKFSGIAEKQVSTKEGAWTQVGASTTTFAEKFSENSMSLGRPTLRNKIFAGASTMGIGNTDRVFAIMNTVRSVYGSASGKSPYQVLQDSVKSERFEVLFAFIIGLNVIFMSAHLQWLGVQNGYDLQFESYESKAEDAWPGASDVFNIIEKVFAIIFTIELVLRVLAYRWRWFCSTWNYIDLSIVILAVLPWVLSTKWAVNPTLVRLARFGKLMRIVRVMRTNSVVGALKLLICSIQSSVNTLFWSLCVLMLFQIFAAISMSYFLLDVVTDTDREEEVRREVFAYFGTFWRSTVTMFEIIFANWGPICRLLLDHVDEASGIFFLLYRCVIGFAILAVIQAVFIQQTMRKVQHDEDTLIEMKTRDKALFIQRLKRVFHEIDKNGDGVISWGEFEPIMEDSRMQGLMATLEINTKDVDVLFQELDDGDGEISIDEFMKGIGNMQGGAKALDLITVINICRRVEAKLDAVPFGCNWKETRKVVRQWRHKTVHKSQKNSHSSRGGALSCISRVYSDVQSRSQASRLSQLSREQSESPGQASKAQSELQGQQDDHHEATGVLNSNN